MSDPTRKVPLGRTGLKVTKFGLGSAALGWLYSPVSDDQAQATVRRAYELGCRFFDTSPYYGHGLAETRIGAALAGLPRESFVLSTKAGYAIDSATPLPEQPGHKPEHPGFDFSYDGILRSVEGSLKRLGLDRIDILLIHDPDDAMDQALSEAYPALRRLRDEGVVKAIGAGMNRSDLLARLVREADFDCVLLAGRYTLIDQTALDDLLPLALERGVAVYAGGPFNSGVLADPDAPGAMFNYGPAPSDWKVKARLIRGFCERYGSSLKSAAIQFPLGHPAIVAVLTGARSVAELEENINLFRRPIPSPLWSDIRNEGLLDERVSPPPLQGGWEDD